MKNTVFLALMILAALPASAQRAASPNCSANSETMAALAAEYASRIDGLLRDAHASLQTISEGVEAGSMSNEQAQTLKLTITRDVISRLDAISAIYDIRLNSENKATSKSRENAGAIDKMSGAASNPSGTVSVEELRCETAAALARTNTEQVVR